MSQVSSITINDGSATPVAKTFAPERVSPERTVFAERTSGISAGYTRLAVGFSPATSRRATTRVDVELDLPALASSGGAVTVSHTARFKGYFVLPDVMSASDRANLIAYVANALDNTLIRGVVKDLDPLY